MTTEQQIYALRKRIRLMRIERAHRLIEADLIRALRPRASLRLLPFPLVGGV